MTTADNGSTSLEERAVRKAVHALRLVSGSLGYLSGLAALVRVSPSWRLGTAGVFASGHLVLNPSWFDSLSLTDAVFVLAHELMHLALRTHERGQGEPDSLLVNIAHDCIINDILRSELGLDAVPAGGLWLDGAAQYSLEELIVVLKQRMRSGAELPRHAWVGRRPGASLGDALREKTSTRRLDERALFDVLPEALEREWFGDGTGPSVTDAIEEASVQATLLRGLRSLYATEPGERRPTWSPDLHTTRAVQAAYAPAWEGALQRWLDYVFQGGRTYARPSRRGQRPDLVLVGRKREGLLLNLVLDVTHRSTDRVPKFLGALASLLDACGVTAVRAVQCDASGLTDEIVLPEELPSVVRVPFDPLPPEQPPAPAPAPRPVAPPSAARAWDYRPSRRSSGRKARRPRTTPQGYSGPKHSLALWDQPLPAPPRAPPPPVNATAESDVVRAMRVLAEDPEVTAVLVFAGSGAFPPESDVPYVVCWATPWDFRPGYGEVVQLER